MTDSEQSVAPSFSDTSAQNTSLAVQETQEWIEVRTPPIAIFLHNGNATELVFHAHQAVTGRTFSASFRESLEDGVLLCQ